MKKVLDVASNRRQLKVVGCRGNWTVYQRGIRGNGLFPTNQWVRVRCFANQKAACDLARSLVWSDRTYGKPW